VEVTRVERLDMPLDLFEKIIRDNPIWGRTGGRVPDPDGVRDADDGPVAPRTVDEEAP
jgi:hypothetical protein